MPVPRISRPFDGTKELVPVRGLLGNGIDMSGLQNRSRGKRRVVDRISLLKGKAGARSSESLRKGQ